MASCLKGRISAILILLSCCSGQAFAQFTASNLASYGVPGFQASNYGGMRQGGVSRHSGSQKWDYRFDPQFQSTIKPYMRWYMRYNPQQPGNRVLPRDFGYGVKYGYASYNYGAGSYGHTNNYSTCDGSCGQNYGGGNYYYGGGRNQPSLYWNHLRYLRDMYGHTTVNRETTRRPRTPGRYRSATDADDDARDSEGKSDYDTDPVNDLSVEISGRKDVWIARNEQTGTFSVLFKTPPASQVEKFATAVATLGAGAKIVNLEWAEKPDWETDVRLVDGRLQSRL